MVNCFVPDCQHCSERDECGFKRFPMDVKVKKKWISLIRRADRKPSDECRVCSCHFVDKDFNNLPSIFHRNEKKLFHFRDPERRTRKCARKEDGSVNVEDVAINVEDAAVNVEDVARSIISAEEYTQIEGVQFRSFGIQPDHEWSPGFYEAEIYFKDREINKLTENIRKLQVQPFSFSCNIAGNDGLCLHYTGLNCKVFELLTQLCQIPPMKYYEGKSIGIIPFQDQLLLTLMKLRLNLTYIDLGVRFGLSASTAFRIVYSFLPVLHMIVWQSTVDHIPTQRKNKRSLPSGFEPFSDCRIVIDCTEFQCEVPKSMREKKMTYSSYKKRTTVKLLTGVAPNGTITFCSLAYPGSTSDKAIVKHSGLLRLLQPGDLILADKGFLIHDILPQGVGLNIPPFLMADKFSDEEVIETKNIARARVHVERANARIKRYRILNLIPKSLFTRVSMVIQTCCGLVNFQNPLFKCMAEDFLLHEDEPENVEDEDEPENVEDVENDDCVIVL